MSEIIDRVAVALEETFKSSVAASAGIPFAETGVSLPHPSIWDAYASAATEALLKPNTGTEVFIRSQSGEAYLQSQLDRAVMAERNRCLSILKSIEPMNPSEAHLIETIVRRIRGSE